MMIRLLLFVGLFWVGVSVQAQDTLKVLWLGNSYTNYNNLPNLTKDCAASAGHLMAVSSNTPGGYKLSQHATNATSQDLIGQGSWDYVVLQEQSQLPSFPIGQVETECFPFATQLCQQVRVANPCSQVVFYQTWGRKNGDASNCANWPPVCTYTGMDSLLALRYRMMADTNQAYLSPVGAVWRYLRENAPSIELYNADESHPSLAGSYAAACSFVSVLFGADPTTIPFDSSLDPAQASTIREAAKLIVYDNLAFWNVGNYNPSASFSMSIAPGTYTATFDENCTNTLQYFWDFGDGSPIVNTPNPTHTFPSQGPFTVTLVAEKCGMTSSITDVYQTDVINTTTTASSEITLMAVPNPFIDAVTLRASKTIAGNSELMIVDTVGKVVMSKQLRDFNELTLSLGHLPSGTYSAILNQRGKKTMITLQKR